MSPTRATGDLLRDPGPVELVPPDIAPFREGNVGIPFVSCRDSGRPGPHVLICALMYGNEISGAIATDGAREITTPYDDCVLVMPARRLARGQTAVRLGRRHRFEDSKA